MGKINLLFIGLFLLITGVVTAQSTQWEIDKSHTKVQFVAKHLKISNVSGQFKEFSGKVNADREDFTDADISATIQVESIDTDNEKRDKHLLGEDFFEAEKYPEITFESVSISKEEGDNYKLKGDLTIKDITRTENFKLEYLGTVEAMGATRAGFQLTGVIDRFDYNVDWDNTFGQGLVVGRDIKINVDVELIKKE
ncbi:MAG: YceI family protein [Bacteroidales bacterium]